MTDPTFETWEALEALERAVDTLLGISTPMMEGDNLAILICDAFENPDQDEGGNSWTPDAMKGYDEVNAAIAEHFGPAIARVRDAHSHLMPKGNDDE